MKVSNVKPWQQISKQKQRKPLKETCSKLKFEPMKHGPTNRELQGLLIFLPRLLEYTISYRAWKERVEAFI